MQVEGRKILVLGAGRSGVAAAKFVAVRGGTVALHDRKPLEEWSEEARSLKTSHNVGLLSGQIPSWLLDQIDLVIISPGIPANSVPARYVDRKDGEVIGEVELAYRFLKGKMIGITGSNGKTTTTTLVGEILKDAGMSVLVGGNIGTPLLSLVEDAKDETWIVTELSSFQLETIADLRPRIGACLNVTPNHMDRYDLFSDYAAAKHRLFLNQTDEDLAVLNADDHVTSTWAEGLKAHIAFFSVKKELDEGLFLRGGELISRAGNTEKVLAVREDILLRGLHNVENVLAAFAICLACGVSPDSMRKTVRNFKGVEHRMEFVAKVDDVSYYNDSKATSVDAALKALEALSESEGKTVLILGGRGKNAPYAPLIPLIRATVRTLVVYGEDGDNIAEQLKGTAEIVRAGTMAEAVRSASDSAKAGDNVLLAPACSSFDMFRSFEERGDSFRNAVKDLTVNEEASGQGR